MRERTRVGLVVIAGALALLAASVSQPVAGRTEAGSRVVITVDSTIEHQVMEGFGATHVSLVYEGKGDVLSPALRARAIDAVYGQVGISMGNLEGAQTEAIKRKVVDVAAPLGFDNYFLGPTVNTRWASPWLARLRKWDYNRYLDGAAEQVAAGQIYWRDNYGILPRYQMPFNEPLSGNKELARGTVQDVVDIVKRAGVRLRREGFQNVGFVVPNEETEEKSLRTAAAVLADPEARQYVGAIGYHPYPYGSVYASIAKILGTSGAGRPDQGRIAVRKELRALGKKYGIPTWMTEVSHGFDGLPPPDNARQEPFLAQSVRARAIHIHDELVHADAAAYFGMNNMWDATSHRLHYAGRDRSLFAEEGNIVLLDNETEAVHITGMGYAIGHYARWIKRGAVRIEATSGDPLIQVTAFRDARRRRLVAVIINNAAAERAVEVSVKGLRIAGGNLAGEQSVAGTYWRPIAPFPPSGSAGFRLSVPGESVTTISGAIQG